MERKGGNRVDDSNYFYMYFYIEESEYFKYEQKIENMTEELNQTNEISEYEKILSDDIFKTGRLSYCINILNKLLIKKKNIVKWNLYYSACKNLIIISKKNSYRIDIIFINAFENMDEDHFNNTMKEISVDYCNLWVYNRITDHYLKSERIKALEKLIREMCENIEKEYDKINLLEDNSWNINNIEVLHDYLGEDRTKKILWEWLNKNTIINFLKNGICTLYDRNEYYYADANSNEKEKIDNILKDIKESELDKNSKNIIHIYKNARKQNPTKTLDGTDIIF